MLLLTLRGTPFLYSGEELGLEDGAIPADRVVDPGGRDGCRSPIPWESGPTHGWPGDDPWLPWPPDPNERNAQAETDDPASILHLYRRLLVARRASSALRAGTITLLDGLPDGVLAYERVQGVDRRVVVINFGAEEVVCDHPAVGDTVQVSSDGSGQGAPFSGVLGPDKALVLQP